MASYETEDKAWGLLHLLLQEEGALQQSEHRGTCGWQLSPSGGSHGWTAGCGELPPAQGFHEEALFFWQEKPMALHM